MTMPEAPLSMHAAPQSLKVTASQRLAVSRCLRRNVPFALYALPGSMEPTFIASLPSRDEYLNIREAVPGSVSLTFFNEGEATPVTILPDMDEEAVLNLPQSSAQKFPEPDLRVETESTSATHYFVAVNTLVEAMKKPRASLKKVVLSRVITRTADHADPLEAAITYFNRFPDTLRILFFTQETGLWMAATPEVLLSYHDGMAHTMALAGTGKSDSPEWDAKNLEEQRLVKKFVMAALDSCGAADVSITEEDLHFGPLRHFCTRFTFPASPQMCSLVLKMLDPTPAVCGSPTPEAVEAITRHEWHDRACYAGTITVHGDGSARDTFVNLRCAHMELLPPDQTHPRGAIRYNIITGGGLTRHSNAEAEWEETVAKAMPLICALEQTDEPRSHPTIIPHLLSAMQQEAAEALKAAQQEEQAAGPDDTPSDAPSLLPDDSSEQSE